LIYGEVTKEDIACTIDIPVNISHATRAAEHLGSTQAMVDAAATSTCLTGVLLCAENDLAPGMFMHLVDKMLAEAIV
jgi:hypothetical protein